MSFFLTESIEAGWVGRADQCLCQHQLNLALKHLWEPLKALNNCSDPDQVPEETGQNIPISMKLLEAMKSLTAGLMACRCGTGERRAGASMNR